MKKLHERLAPGTRHLDGVLESLPLELEDNEVMIACYTHDGDEIVVAGYYKTKGYYEGRIARPDGYTGDISLPTSKYSKRAKKVCGLQDCWAGGDTGGFYYED